MAAGEAELQKQGIGNVRLVCASCLNDTLDWNCDYLVSRTALIYLNHREMEAFLQKRLPLVRRKMLLEEIVSLTGRTESSHFFAHPLGIMAQAVGEGRFVPFQTLLDYPPWKRAGFWSGATIVVARNAL